MVDNPRVIITAEVDTSNLKADTMFETFNEMIEGLNDKVNDGVEDAVENLSELVKMEQESNLIRGDHIASGALLSSILIDLQGLSSTIGPTVEGYAANVIEYGRGEVVPVSASCLHYWTKFGEEVFSMRSKPFPPDPFVAPSAEVARDRAVGAVIRGVRSNL